ncbi:hypothetical protein BH10ACT11_BH10ACT11_11240 [soil metagenome]
MGELPRDFSFVQRKDNTVVISWKGRPVSTLAGTKAQRFVAAAAGEDDNALQMRMAKATGNFKHGNERRG